MGQNQHSLGMVVRMWVRAAGSSNFFRHELSPFVDFWDQGGDFWGERKEVLLVKMGLGFPNPPRFLGPGLLIPSPGDLSLTSVLGLRGARGAHDVPGKQPQTDRGGLPGGCAHQREADVCQMLASTVSGEGGGGGRAGRG